MFKRVLFALACLAAFGYLAWRVWDHYDRRARSRAAREAAAQLDVALDRPVTLALKDVPLRKVVAQLEREHGVDIEVDAQALGAINLREDPHLSITLRDVPLRKALGRIARRVHPELVAVPRAGRVLITTRDDARDDTMLEIYPLPPHLVGVDGITEQQFAKVVTDLLIGHSYGLSPRGAADYPLAAAAAPANSNSPAAVELTPGGIAVVAPPETHREIRRLLKILEEVELDPDSIDVIPLEAPSAIEQRIFSALRDRASIDAKKEPLRWELDRQGAAHGITIEIDKWDGFDADALDPLDMQLQGVSLGTLLRSIARHYEIGLEVRDDAVCFADPDAVENHCVVRVYPVPDLLHPRGGYSREQLTDIVTSNIYPTTWTDVGGTCGAEVCGHALVISAYEEIHEELVELLAILRRHNEGLSPLVPVPESRARIEQILKKNASATFLEKPLKDVVLWFNEEYDLPVQLDQSALDAMGVSKDSPVTFQATDRPLAAVLNDLLREIEATWVIDDNELVRITTPDEVETQLNTRVYDIRHLVAPDFGVPDYDMLIDMITSITQPTTWTDVGGTGAILEGDGCLVVTQTDDVHVEVEGLLAQLESLYDHPEDFTPRELSSLAPEKDRAIQKSLSQVVLLDAEGITFFQLGALLEENYGIETQIDTTALDAVGVRSDRVLQGHFRDIALRSALKLVLLPHECTIEVRDGAMLITTPEEIDNGLITRIYNVSDIIYGPSGSKDYYSLVDLITSTIAPDSWTDVGGIGAIHEYDTSMASALVISQNQDVLDQVDLWLATYRNQRDPARYPEPTPTAAEKRIAEVLDAPCDLVFNEVTLRHFAAELSSRWNVNVISATPMDDVARVTCDIHGDTARDALRTALEPHGLNIAVAYEAVLITSKDEAISLFGLTETYYSDDAIARSEIAPTQDDAINLLVELVDLWSWYESGNLPGSLNDGAGMLPDADGMVLVRQSVTGHAEVKEYFEFLAASDDEMLPAPPLDMPLFDAKRDWVIQQLTNGPLDFRTRYAAYVAGQNHVHTEQFVPALVALLERLDPARDASLHDITAIALARIGPKADAASPILAARLAAMPDHRRRSYFKILSHLGPQAATALVDFICEMKNPAEIRQSALVSLVSLGESAEAEVPRLLEGVTAHPWRWYALRIESLSRSASDPGLIEVLTALDPDFVQTRELVKQYEQSEDSETRDRARVITQLLKEQEGAPLTPER